MGKVLSFDLARHAGADVRHVPTYAVSEAARYLRVPQSTVRAWTMGQRGFRPVLTVERGDRILLSFVNLVEVHVLGALRRQHRLSLPKIRRSLRFLAKQYPDSRHPLAELDLSTDGFALFVEEIGKLVDASDEGQLAMRRLLEAHLKRVDKDIRGLPVRLYPFTRKPGLRGDESVSETPRSVVIDPEIAFGRPVLAGTGIPTEVIADRYRAGDSIHELAEDYHRPPAEIEEAIRCELLAAA